MKIATYLLQKPFVSFKAGMVNKSERDNGTKMWLSADKQRGLLQLVRDADGMMHLQWKDRRTNVVGFVSYLLASFIPPPIELANQPAVTHCRRTSPFSQTSGATRC